MEAEKANFPVRLMCRVFEVSRSGFYAWRRRPESQRRRDDRRLLLSIKAVHAQSKRRYGSPRVTRELNAQGESVGRHRVARLMREHGLRARRRRRHRVTTLSKHDHPVAGNVLARRFDVNGPNQVFASDITYVWTMQGWLYLSVVLDLYSRRVVGFSMGERINAQLTIEALRMALKSRRLASGVVHHSDRGSQYASGAYQALLDRHGIRCSMSRKGDCWDNAVVESFFATLKVELIHEAVFVDREQARREIFEYIELFYNRWRRHSYLGYVSPVDYENQAPSMPKAA